MDPNLALGARVVGGLFLFALGTAARKEIKGRDLPDAVGWLMALPFYLAGLYLLAWVWTGRKPF